MSERETIVIVGPGRAGTSLARLWQRAGHVVAAICGGSDASNAASRQVLGAAIPVVDHAAALSAGTLVVVAVPDDHLDAAVAQLVPARPPPESTLVIHVAGARGAGALAPLARAGARTAAFHPLHAFATRDPGGPLEGALCAVEADPSERARLFALATAIGGTPFQLSAENRALYHAGAAAAGNGVLALLDLGLRALEHAGVPRDVALRALVELSNGALDNAAALGPAAALTGPVVRGDKDVVTRHLVALDAFSPVDERFYWAVTRALIRLASQRPDGWKAREVASASDDLARTASSAGGAGA